MYDVQEINVCFILKGQNIVSNTKDLLNIPFNS